MSIYSELVFCRSANPRRACGDSCTDASADRCGVAGSALPGSVRVNLRDVGYAFFATGKLVILSFGAA